MAPLPLPLVGDRMPLPRFAYLSPAALALAELPTGACRWPFGETASAAFSFCGARARHGQSYCARHMTMARRRAARVEARPSEAMS